MRQLEFHVSDSIRLYDNRQTDEYPPHWHYSYEIIMPVVGTYTAVVDQNAYDILPGEVFVIPSGVVHELYPNEEGERYIFMIDQDVILQTEGLPMNRQIFYPFVHLRHDMSEDILPQVSKCLWHVIREEKKKDGLSASAIRSWMTLLLVSVSRWALEKRPPDSNERRHAMNAAMLDVYAYITAHCNEKLTLEDMADQAGYSKYHFARVFKEYTGTNFHDFYMRQRTRLCTRMLTELNIPVTEVALRAGFDSIASFNGLFRHYTGMTPTQFRQLKTRQYTENDLQSL